MVWASTLLAALKAIPEISKGIRDLISAFKEMQNSQTQRNLDEIKQGVRKYISRIENAKNNKERALLIRELNILLSR